MIPQHVDIVINGGGLVGNSLALALAKTSYQIAIVEPFPLQHVKRSLLESRTIAISHGAKRIYEGLGVWDALLPFVTPIEHIHVSDRGHFGLTHIHASDQQLPALGYVIQIAEVNRILQQQLQQYSNIHLLCPAKVKAAELSADNIWQMQIEHQDKTQALQAHLLIAADGAQSQLRQQLNLALEEKDYGQTALVCVIELTRAHGNIAYERFTPEGPLAILPMQKNFCTAVVTVTHKQAAQWQQMPNAEFLAALQERFGYRLGRFVTAGPRIAFPLKLVTAPQQILSQFVLIGNAAHTLHPIAAQSFNLSLRDVALLAEYIYAQQRAGNSLQQPDFLQAYINERQADQHRTVQFTDNLIQIFANSTLTLPRNLAMLSLDLTPPLKTLLGKWGAGSLGKLSRLARGLPL